MGQDVMTVRVKYEKKNSLLAFLVAICIVLANGDSIYGAYNIKLRYGILLALCIILGFVMLEKKKLKRSTLLIYCVLGMMILFSMIANSDYRGYTMWFFLGIGILVSNFVCFDEFCIHFERIIFFLSICALLGAGIAYITPNLVNSFPDFVEGVTPMKNLFVTYVPTVYLTSISEYRCYGIFREPGMFAIYIGFALLSELHVRKDKSLIRIFVFLFTMIMTRSSTGYIATGVLIFGWLLTSNQVKLKKQMCLLIFTIIMIILFFRSDIISSFISKFNISGSSADSVNSRLTSIIAGGVIGFTHPLFGAGATKVGELYNELAPLYGGGKTFANMITYLFSAFGLGFITIILLGIWGYGIRIATGSKKKAVLVLLVVCLFLCGQTMTYSSLLYIFVMYGWRRISSKQAVSLKNVDMV